jgi:hypothetical protein
MKKKFYLKNVFSITVVALFLSVISSFRLSAQYNFSHSNLKGASFSAPPTSLQFGPDKKLYVAQQDGLIKVFTVVRNSANSYSVTKTVTISLINKIPNHNDDGTVNTGVITRQITGILVKGTAANPVIYVSSSDSRIGGPTGDVNLDTNSGIISTLTWNGSTWVKLDLVRGLPRSEENHATNGMQLNPNGKILYVSHGGHTNGGSPSNKFAFTCEYALSAAVLSVNLEAINQMPTKNSGTNTAYKYDLPTLDDPTRANVNGRDPNDPFGGNDGLNMAKIVSGGPVQIYAPGFRNAFDLLITKAGNMYNVDNGGSPGWGGYPENEGTGRVTNRYLSSEPGSTSATPTEGATNNMDNFHFIGNIATYVPGSFYGGFPNPVRANPYGAGLYTRNGSTGVFRTSKSGTKPLPADWPPVASAHAIEGDYQMPGVEDKCLLTFTSSTNGLTEYTASNFNGYLKGDILAASYDGYINLIRLSSDGKSVLNRKGYSRLNKDPYFATNFGTQPLDITAQGDNDIFPGTVWVTLYGTRAICVFEPKGYGSCSGTYSTTLDEDGDGYKNADEIDNNSGPCSASSIPPDNDDDFVSDLKDSDDDNDGISDITDLFPVDKYNGKQTFIPVKYELLNSDPGTGFFGLGFTGLMTAKAANYSKLFDPNNLSAGGAVGAFTISKVSSGTAKGSTNTQKDAFQFGIKLTNTLPYTVQSGITGPFFNGSPKPSQSQGIYIGTGDQDNYFKVALIASGFEVVYEKNGVSSTTTYSVSGVSTTNQTIDLFLSVDPSTGKVQPKYSINKGTVIKLGSPVSVTEPLLTVIRSMKGTSAPALAIGVIATSGSSGSPFEATWDYINVITDGTTGTEVSTFTLVNATSDADIGQLTNNYVIDLSKIRGKSINVRANTKPAVVGSVSFELNGNPSGVENGAPYALYGDQNYTGDYNSWTPNPGNYTLKATPYSSANATGTKGTSLTVNFKVINGTSGRPAFTSATENQQVKEQPATFAVKAYPNPGRDGRYTVLLPARYEGDVNFSLVGSSGSLLTGGKISLRNPTSVLAFDFSRQMISPGLYYLILESKKQKAQVELIRAK